MIRLSIQLICLPLPWKVRRWLLSKLSGFAIDPDSSIGLTLILADEVRIAKGARLGHFNYVGRLDLLQLDDDAFIGNFNWITGLSQRLDSPFYRKRPNRRSDLVMGRCSMMGNQHFIDCTDRIEFMPFAGLAGVRSQLISHGVEPIASRQTCGPITIGAYTMVGTGSMIMKGVRIPDCCIVSAGSVVLHIKNEPYSLIAGNPATPIRKIPETAKLFLRTESVIH